jgi:hypothetical protein
MILIFGFHGKIKLRGKITFLNGGIIRIHGLTSFHGKIINHGLIRIHGKIKFLNKF